MSAEIKNYYTHGPSVDTQRIVILLHGVGSNGQDLIQLAPMLNQKPGTLYISPDAPFMCDMVPPGYPESFQWFSLQNRDPHVMLQEIKVSQPILNNFIDDTLRKYEVSPGKVALVGFSQGTMMSLYTAPRYSEKLAGVLGYSGALIGEAELEESHLSKIPIHLIHGEADDVVPVDAYSHARACLEKAGFDVSGNTTPGLPHSIDEQGIQSGGEFLTKIFSK